jgi:hypothetical protein
MSEEHNPNPDNPVGQFLAEMRERIVSGESAYGDPQCARAIERLAEIDAKLALGRQLGEIAPAPEPWSVQRAASERLAQEFPAGASAGEMNEVLAQGVAAKFDHLAGLSTREQSSLAQQVADDFVDRTSGVSLRHAAYRDGGFPNGATIVEALLQDAQPAIRALAKPGEAGKLTELLRLDRNLLELYASRGQSMAAYSARKAKLGLG